MAPENDGNNRSPQLGRRWLFLHGAPTMQIKYQVNFVAIVSVAQEQWR